LPVPCSYPLYARLYDETVHAQFREATAAFESIAVEEWPQPQIAPPVLAVSGGKPTGEA
jgi:hypothetical protein